MPQLLIPRDFNLVVNETSNLYGTLSATTPGGVEIQRKEFKAGGAAADRNPITGLKFMPFKFKVIAYPDGFDSLPIGQPLALSWSEYITDEENPDVEMGIRHYYFGELDPPSQSERKRDELAEWDYEVKNTRIYRKYKNEKLVDELDLNTNTMMLNGQPFWQNRRRILQLG
jgi:hypothetical protein